MKEVKDTIEYKGESFPLVFNLNVMETIQDEFKTIEAWGDLTDGKSGEVNIKAMIFGFWAMLNEGLEIENEENNTKRVALTKKQVGRMLTEIGMQKVNEKMSKVVIDSAGETEEDKEKNE